MKKVFGFHRTVFFLGLVSFFTDASSEMIYPLLPVFLSGTLHASYSLIGLIESIAEGTASFLKLASGILSDKFKNRKTLTFSGYFISSSVRPLIGIAASPFHVLLIRFSDRVGKGIRTSPRDALIADVVPQEERGRAYGFHRAMDHTGAIVGPVLASLALLFLTKNIRAVFLMAYIPAIIALIVLAAFVKDEREQETGGRGQKKQEKIAFSLSAFDGKFKKFLAVVFLFTLGNSSDAFLILKAKQSGLTDAFIPMLWMGFHVVKMAGSTPFGSLSDRIGRKRVILSGWLLYSAVYFGFAFTQALPATLFLFALYGIFYGLTEGVERAFVSDLVQENQRASAFGYFHFTVGIGLLPASLIFGFLWDTFHHAGAAFMFGGCLSLFAALLMLLFL